MAEEEQAQDAVSGSGEDIKKIIEATCKHSGKTEAEVRKLIEEKQDELSGLVSEEGAAYIIARELGVNLLKAAKRQLKVKNLISGLRSVEIVGRIVRIFEPREWEKEGKSGVVQNLILGDETGMVRLSLWNEETDLVKIGEIKDDDTIRITGGYVKTDNRGNPELRIGKGKLEKVEEEVTLPDTKEIKRDFGTAHRKSLADLKEGDFAEVRACLVQVFRRNPVYEVCPTCGVRATEDKGKWTCKEHGEVNPEYRMVIAGVVDDGFGNIRVVFFGEIAEKLLGKNAAELGKLIQDGNEPMAIYEDFPALGREFVIKGRVKKNDLTESLEFVANDIEDIDIKKEAGDLIKELKG